MAGTSQLKMIPIPRRPKLATLNPITAPPSNAMRSARACPLSRAASLVRTFARVAAFIPASPARIEEMPPATYAYAVNSPMATYRSAPMMRTKGITTEYSRRRNAIAPV
jgi:hypothetical protein